MALARAVGGRERETAAVCAMASPAPSARTAPSNARTNHFIGFLRKGSREIGFPCVLHRLGPARSNSLFTNGTPAPRPPSRTALGGLRGGFLGNYREAAFQIRGSPAPRGAHDGSIDVNAHGHLGAGVVLPVPAHLHLPRPAGSGE